MVSLLQPQQPVKQGGVSMDPITYDTDPQKMEERINRNIYGMTGRVPTDTVALDMMSGNELRLREHTASALALSEYQDDLAYISSISLMAAQEGRPLTEDEQAIILNQEIPRYNPNLVLEILYSRRFMDDIEAEDSILETAEAENSDATRQVRNFSEEVIQKQEVARRVLEESIERWESRGLLGQIWDVGRGIIPFYSDFQQRGRLSKAGSGEFFLGEAIQAQVTALWSLPPDEFEVRLREAISELGEENTMEAMALASAVIEYSGSDALWDNIWTALDLADVALIGGSAISGVAGYIGKSQRAIRAASVDGSEAARQVAQGNVQGAARTKARRHLNLSGAGSTIDEQIQKLQDIVPDLLNGEKFLSDPGSLSAEATRRILNQVSHDEELLLSTFETMPIVRRIPEEARERAFEKAEAMMPQLYENFEDSVINIRRRTESDEVFGGVDYIEAYLGNRSALPFRQKEYAEFYANDILKLPTGGYDIVEEHGNYLIRVTKTIDETDLEIRDLRIDTGYETEANFYNTYLSYFDSSNNQLSKAHSAVRSVATHAAEAMMARMAHVAKNIGKLNKGEIQRLTEVMDGARMQQRTIRLPDGSTQQVTGKYYRTAAELEKEYQKRFKRNPSEKEVQAYMSFRTLMDMDYLMRNAGTYRDLARQGVQQYAFEVIGENGALATSNFVNGRVVDSLPTGNRDFTVGWYDAETGKVQSGIYSRLGRYYSSLRDTLETGDYKIIQLADARDKTISNLFDARGEPIDFVVVRNVKTKPLAAQQVPYNEAGHSIYPHVGMYLKQTKSHRTKTGRRVVDGDTTLMYFQTTAEGKKFEKAFNTAREMLQGFNAGTVSRAALERYLGRNLPYDFDGFKKLFEGDDAPFNLDTPFALTKSGQRASDVLPLDRIFPNEEIYDPRNSQFNLLNNVDTSFAQERNERLLNVNTSYGSQRNPVYNLRLAPQLNSMEALKRTASDMARSRYFTDYKRREVENWANQFADLMDAPRERVLSNPMEYIKNPKFVANVDKRARGVAMTARRNILSLMGEYSESDSVWRSFRQAAANAVYNVGGTRAVDMVEPLLWSSKTDPVAAIRGFAFDAKLGLFNVIQLPLQASAVSMAYAIDGSPVRAAQSVLAYNLLSARRLAEGAPQIQKSLTSKFGKALGMDEALLDEMYYAWRNSGFDVTGGSMTYLNDYLNPADLFSGNVNRAREASRYFFHKGNDIHKTSSYILAFLRWRAANPKARLDNAAMEAISARANTYYLNMSKNSDAAWQNPKNWAAQIAVLPLQFAAFQHRLTSLLIGKELSGFEKLRLFAMNSVLWGIPVGGGGSLLGGFGLPIGDWLRQAAIDQGYDPSTADTVTRIMMDGLLDIGVEQLFGFDTNVSERFGPGGLDWGGLLLDMARGEGDVREFFGAAPNLVIDFIGQTQPIAAGMASVFFDEDGTYLNIVQDDVIAALREVSSVNNTTRAWQVYNAGLWLTQNEGLVATYDKGDPMLAIAAALSLQPQEIADTYLKMDSVNSHDQAKRQTVSQAIVYFERGLRAHANGDFDQGQSFFKHANAMMVIAGLTPLERQEAWSRAARSNETLIDSIHRKWAMQDPERRINWNVGGQE